MMSYLDSYFDPHGYCGTGSNIKWCGRWNTGKRCLLCTHHANFEEWSETWKFYYLVDWSDDPNTSCIFYRNYVHFKFKWSWHNCYGGTPQPYRIKPVRYRTAGLRERDLMQLLDKGCKPKRKCKCVSVAQRGNWYCPQCWRIIEIMAKHKSTNIHNLMVGDRDELKAEILMLQLSGTL